MSPWRTWNFITTFWKLYLRWCEISLRLSEHYNYYDVLKVILHVLKVILRSSEHYITMFKSYIMMFWKLYYDIMKVILAMTFWNFIMTFWKLYYNIMKAILWWSKFHYDFLKVSWKLYYDVVKFHCNIVKNFEYDVQYWWAFDPPNVYNYTKWKIKILW